MYKLTSGKKTKGVKFFSRGAISYNDHDEFIVNVNQRGTHATTARSAYI
jgi:hypothetical protein